MKQMVIENPIFNGLFEEPARHCHGRSVNNRIPDFKFPMVG